MYLCSPARIPSPPYSCPNLPPLSVRFGHLRNTLSNCAMQVGLLYFGPSQNLFTELANMRLSADMAEVPPVGGEGNSAAESSVSHTDTGLPRADGACLSYWLEGVRSDPLLDHRSGDLPDRADVVIIGSGVGLSSDGADDRSLVLSLLLSSYNPPTHLLPWSSSKRGSFVPVQQAGMLVIASQISGGDSRSTNSSTGQNRL